MNGHPLAILVPAYKPEFLKEALRSVAGQTDSRFQVYIFDDGGPASLRSIAEPFLTLKGWHFHRFPENMGGYDLVGHWNRCVEQTTEPWIWLFSDDDVMDPTCVETFYQQSGNPAIRVYRFGQRQIDANGHILPNKQTRPFPLKPFEFGKEKFFRELDSSAVEFIFHRDGFNSAGGFIRFPLAWCSDDASWIAFAGDQPIGYLSGPLVSWRFSGSNLSALYGRLTRSKMKAAVSFIRWFNQRFENQVDAHFRAEQVIWLRLQMVHQNYLPGFFETISLVRCLEIPLSVNWLRAFGDLYALSYVYWKTVIRKEQAWGVRALVNRILPKF